MTSFPPVLILAGGFGTRISNKYPNIPKFLVPINNVPFAFYQLRLLKKMGFSDVILCVGYKKELIKKLIKNGANFGLHIEYSEDEEQPLGTGGAIKKASRHISSPFCVIYGDSYLEFDFAKAYQTFIFSKKKALMTIFHNRNEQEKSNILMENNEIILFDKVNQNLDMEYIDYGFQIFSSDIFENYKNNIFDLSDPVKKLIAEKQMATHEVYNCFFEIGSLEGICALENYLMAKKT
jgi:NDP-sugar pyrophosphorylase family protein